MLDLFLTIFPSVLLLLACLAITVAIFLYSLEILMRATDKAEGYFPIRIQRYVFPLFFLVYMAFFSSAVLTGVLWVIQ